MKKILCAMSGGVDSSVSAYLLKKQGYDVTGVYLIMFKGQEKKSQEVKKICNYLKIPFISLNISKSFKKEVIDYFISEYEFGRTPNPCIMCNPKIKFKELINIADKMKIKYIATGHYVRLQRKITNKKLQIINKSKIQNPKLQTILLEAKDKKKDQSYFLYRLKYDVLKRTIFPLGEYYKEDVKKLAFDANLPITEKKESQDICFIKDNDIHKFLNKKIKYFNKLGNVIDRSGVVLGKHNGIVHYTIGQRSGLSQINIENSCIIDKKSGSKVKADMIPPLYVVKLDVNKNEIVLGVEKDLYSRDVNIEKINWINPDKIGRLFFAQARVRSSSKKEDCKVEIKGQKIIAKFKKLYRAITPGQSIVFYDGEIVLGGGIIK